MSNTVSQRFIQYMVQTHVKAGKSTKEAATLVARELNSWGVTVVRQDSDNRVGQDRLRKVMAQDVRSSSLRTWVRADQTKVWG